MKLAFMFPGQGAQTAGMGKDIYEEYEEVRQLYDEISKILNIDMCKLCFETDIETLSKTENTQIAIATMSLSILKIIEKNGIQAETLAGLSLGEYVALIHSGVLDLETGMKLLKQRGYLMGHLLPEEKYAMAAVIGLDANIVEQVCNEEMKEGKFVIPANYNYSSQIVISGNEQAVQECVPILKQKGAQKVILLKTSGPFHTIKLKKASEEFAKYLEQIDFKQPKIEVIKNLDGTAYSIDDNIKQILVNHIISPVRFDKTIKEMQKKVDAYVEIGPGKALSGFVKREIPDAKVYTINNLEQLNNFINEITTA